MRKHILLAVGLILGSTALAQPAATKLGAMPTPDKFPKVEFVFEEHVTLSPAVVLGKTAMGNRQYIPITGGTIDGPKFKGKVVPGGWDYQLQTASGCGSLSADYFIQHDDGTMIHVLNESMTCRPGAEGARGFTRAKLEAPEGAHGWMTSGVFLTSIELDGGPPAADGKPAPLTAIRIKFYQIK